VTFDEALTILLGWLGEELEVTLQGADGAPPPLAAELHGHLRSGDELNAGTEPANSLMFILDDEDGEELSTFILSKDAFRSAGWFGDQGEVLEINCGAVQFLVCPQTGP
jgi:hypothetical protein